MIHDVSLKRLEQSFGAQFQLEPMGYLYRRGGTGPAIRVNAQERDDFVRDYHRRLLALAWAAFIGGGVVALAIGGFMPSAASSGWTKPVAMAIVVGLFFVAHLWIRAAPMRVLRYRVPTAAALTSGERRRNVLARLTYTQLLWLVAAALFAVFNAARAWDILHGWARLWIVFGVLMLAIAGVQACRKWRLERSAAAPGR